MTGGVLLDTTISHFTLHEVVGSGGMGIVYRAVDNRLGRPVALKFIRPLGDGTRPAERFLNEARAAASLDHPNICTIFEVDTTAAGDLFIAMAYYTGETLDEILTRGALPLPRALALLIQAGRGLAAAHEELVVHRDVKPGNLMVTQHDTVKILDFGLARLRDERSESSGDFIGTPAYMAPEQLSGGRVDHRADIWSLGAVAYEAITGRRAFAGASIEEIIDSVMNCDPLPLDATLPQMQAIAPIISRALAKDPANRYVTAAAMVEDLVSIRADSDPGAMTLRHAIVQPKKRAIAVLPFTDMSPGRDQDHLCEGIAEEILRALGRIPDLRVVSRTSAFQFKGAVADIRDIGARLNVDTILEGSIRRAGDRMRVSAQLVNVADGYRIWNDRFDRETNDILAIEDEIAERIADALEVTFSGRSAAREVRLTAVDAEAYSLYLQGRQFFHQHRRKGFDIALQTFARVIEMNPRHARAWAGIADCHSFLRLYFGAGDEALAAADEASRKALDLAPELPETHASRGLALFVGGDLDAAERELARAIELDPNLYDVHYVYGRISFSRGNVAEAARHFHTAAMIVPEAYDSWYLLGMCYRRAGDTSRMRNAQLECIDAVQSRLRHHADDTRAWTMGAAVLVELGEPDKAAEWVGRALAIDRDEPIIGYNAACVYAALGKKEEALDCLSHAAGRGGISKAWLDHDPDLDTLRGEARFDEIVGRYEVAVSRR